jgi:TetR/AcrR family transcriptional regulator, cholesterol catabolism regulator
VRERAEAKADVIMDVVIDLLESEGYEAVQVRTVARRAQVSLATIYKLFGTLDRLIASAVERWMEANAYAELTPPKPDESPYEIMVRVLRAVFEPWEVHPRILEAHYRLRMGPSGEWLMGQGKSIVEPLTGTALENADPAYVSDLQLIFCHAHRGAMARFADGEIAVTDILPILERTLWRLTADDVPVTERLSPPAGRATQRAARTQKTRATKVRKRQQG